MTSEAMSLPAQPTLNPERFSKRLWRLVYPYWNSEEKWKARGLLFLIVTLGLLSVYLTVLFNDWYQRFYDGLEKKNATIFWKEMGTFSWLAMLWVVVSVYRVYFQQMLEMHWRNWLNKNFLSSWLGDRAYYRMQLNGGKTDNPDQRIAEDLKLFTNMTLALSLGFLNSAVTLVSFVGILWTISGPLSFTLSGMNFTIPGYMVWGCLAYALIGSTITHWLGRPLIGLNFAQQRFEADYRFGLVRLRENAEGVALYGGEASEEKNLLSHFGNVLGNWWALIRSQKRLGWFTFGYGQAAVIFPFLLAGSRYLSGAITLGTLMQISSAFGQVKDALSWFVDNYVNIAPWKASVDRLLTFRDSIDLAIAQQTTASGIRVEPSKNQVLEISNLDLGLPNGNTIARDVSATINPGERVLLTGPSGSGKSTLFRAIAGIWPFGRGTISSPQGKRVLFLPQKPYLPIGTLRDTVSYPGKPGDFSDVAIAEALRTCRLEQLVTRLDESQHWGQQLSPGEQQRLAFARALLHKPDWLFMDEATSALDGVTEQAMYELLPRKLPGTTVISIAHTPEVARFHTRTVKLVSGPDGSMTLQSA